MAKSFVSFLILVNLATQSSQATAKPDSDSNNATKGKKRQMGEASTSNPQPQGWLDIGDDRNSNVYVSGLPPTVTEEEFIVIHRPYSTRP